ncbi:hypothetical protein [Pseudonocardia sp.]|uniref:MFS transporter small subunit n=1 Tax=Pseudonocardia sp. TaxID=60912 RepID=UPI002611ED45|nr:hypothetical protein [Pseudonocardia sp.]
MSTESGTSTSTQSADGGSDEGRLHPALTALAWLWVVVPFGYGFSQLVIKIPALFGS